MNRIVALCLTLVAVSSALASAAGDWWDKAWTARQEIAVDTTANGFAIDQPIGSALVLLRLHSGNFNFAAVGENGADIRFVAADQKTPLAFQIEKFDSLMNEALVWVKLPEVPANARTSFFIYYGNLSEKQGDPNDPKLAYDPETLLVYHFAPTGSPQDATKNANNASSPGMPFEGALIAAGSRLLGNTAITVPPSDSLKIPEATPLTWSAWFKATSQPADAVLLSWAGENAGLQLRLRNGVPVLEVRSAGSTDRTAPGEALPQGVWKHLSIVADDSSVTLRVDGKEISRLSAPLPALTGPISVGALENGDNGAVGEIDEIQISRTGRSDGWLKFSAVSQSGNDASAKLVALGEEEAGGGGGAFKGLETALEHMALFKDIAAHMMFDGWIAVIVCVIMMIAGWTVAIQKFAALGKIQKGNEEFQKQWKNVARDLTVLDDGDLEKAKSLGGTANAKSIRLMHDSPLYHVYHIGAEEIRHRLTGPNKMSGLSSRSIQAIRAALDAGLVHEQHRLNNGLVLLTISIAGGPYVGLLGTVVGVMITFAVIAKSGEVEVNSIAPGIASALLATTVGLLVAIPALFMYSFLSSRIKEAIGAMQVFIDEFVAKIAEFYPPPGEEYRPVPIQQIRGPEAAAAQEELARANATTTPPEK